MWSRFTHLSPAEREDEDRAWEAEFGDDYKRETERDELLRSVGAPGPQEVGE